jgi:chaperone required for assembly of F1-ATPase
MKKFYKVVSVQSDAAGHAITLDGRTIKTPAKATLLLPTRALADAVAAEWHMQDGTINPKSMPLTRHANSVIDRIVAHRDAVIDEIAKYGGSDLICYRAQGPADLVALQVEAWEPLLDWCTSALIAPLRATAGINPVDQLPESLQALHHAVAAYDNWQLAALHDMVSISGSLVIGLALCRGRITTDAAWQAGQLDELFQVMRWGEDDLALAARHAKREAFDAAVRLFHLLGQA